MGLLLEIGLATGLRVSDLLRLRVRQFGANMRVHESKTKKYKECQLPDKLVQKVEDYIKAHGLLPAHALFHTAHHKDRPYSRIRAYQVFTDAAEKIGLDGIGPHSMRKTYALDVLADNAGDVYAVKRALGHTSLSVTLRYLYSADTLQRMAELMEKYG
jgi:integrase